MAWHGMAWSGWHDMVVGGGGGLLRLDGQSVPLPKGPSQGKGEKWNWKPLWGAMRHIGH